MSAGYPNSHRRSLAWWRGFRGLPPMVTNPRLLKFYDAGRKARLERKKPVLAACPKFLQPAAQRRKARIQARFDGRDPGRSARARW